MSEQEQYAAQGRAHANLKQARSRAAAINTSLREYIRDLEDVARSMTRFVSSPGGNLQLYHSLKESVRCVAEREKICGLVDDLVTETKRVAELEEQIDRF